MITASRIRRAWFILQFVLVVPAFLPLIEFCFLHYPRLSGGFFSTLELVWMLIFIPNRPAAFTINLPSVLILLFVFQWALIRTAGVSFRWVWYPLGVIPLLFPLAMTGWLNLPVVLTLIVVGVAVLQVFALRRDFRRSWLYGVALVGGFACGTAVAWAIMRYGSFWWEVGGLFVVPVIAWLPAGWWFARCGELRLRPEPEAGLPRRLFFVHPLVLVVNLLTIGCLLWHYSGQTFYALIEPADTLFIQGIEVWDRERVAELRDIISPSLVAEIVNKFQEYHCMCTGGRCHMEFREGFRQIVFAHVAHGSQLRFSPTEKALRRNDGGVTISHVAWSRLADWYNHQLHLRRLAQPH